MSKTVISNTMANEKEVRSFSKGQKIELRTAEGKMPTIVGYAAVFDSIVDLSWYQEKVSPGAFSRSLSENDDVRALLDHDVSVSSVLGRRAANTLRLSEDARGLKVEIDLPETQNARDLVQQIETGNVSGMSFGFIVREEFWDYEEEPALRTLLDVELIEVSVVTFPAYPDTSIAQRSYDETMKKFNGQACLAGYRNTTTGTTWPSKNFSEAAPRNNQKLMPRREVLMARHKFNQKKKI